MPFPLDPARLIWQTLETPWALAALLVQQRLGSGSYFPGRANPKCESGVHHFHDLCWRALREREERV